MGLDIHIRDLPYPGPVYNFVCFQDNRKMVHQYKIGNGESRDLPYTRSLFKILEVENRNILLVIRDLLKPECCPVSGTFYLYTILFNKLTFDRVRYFNVELPFIILQTRIYATYILYIKLLSFILYVTGL